MKTVRSGQALRNILEVYRRKGKSIGFVPTMGYLHEGHLSLVRLARRENDLVVASIFVNPLQFGPQEDYKRYPRSERCDAAMLKREKTNILFMPSVREFYPEGFQTQAAVSRLAKPLCGKSRPTHFAGVTTVVLKLLNLVRPQAMWLGQKDYQQVRVLEQMVADLDLPVKVRMAPIVREKDGLAMSSRNVFLDKASRREAAFLYKALRHGRKLVQKGVRDTATLQKAMRAVLQKASHGRVDYLEIVDSRTLERVVKLRSNSKALFALAVFFGKTRLIDNILVRG